MSIPQICPSCGNHISAAHAKDCCFGTTEYAHLGWPSYSSTGDGIALISIAHPTHTHTLTTEELSKDGYFSDNANATAIRRLFDYLFEEPDKEPLPEPPTPCDPDLIMAQSRLSKVLCRLAEKSEYLRKEAAGIYNVEARAKRNFAADILENLISELTE